MLIVAARTMYATVLELRAELFSAARRRYRRGGRSRTGRATHCTHLLRPLRARIHGHAPGNDVQRTATSMTRCEVDVHPRGATRRAMVSKKIHIAMVIITTADGHERDG